MERATLSQNKLGGRLDEPSVVFKADLSVFLLLPDDPGSDSFEASYWSEPRGELHRTGVFAKSPANASWESSERKIPHFPSFPLLLLGLLCFLRSVCSSLLLSHLKGRWSAKKLQIGVCFGVISDLPCKITVHSAL